MNFDINSYVQKYTQRYQKDLEESVLFLEWLNQKSPHPGTPTYKWEKSCYRIVYGGYNPLDISGSLAAGGRFNIGGAQASGLFPNLSMRACLYAASSLSCARKEAGEIKGLAQEYRLKPNRQLLLWDLNHLLKTCIIYKNLRRIVNISPLAARWELQKVPKISQILAHYLRQYGGDGLIYPSTKDQRHLILAFFIKDTTHAEQLFSIFQEN